MTASVGQSVCRVFDKEYGLQDEDAEQMLTASEGDAVLSRQWVWKKTTRIRILTYICCCPRRLPMKIITPQHTICNLYVNLTAEGCRAPLLLFR